jgi:hypothetical protein
MRFAPSSKNTESGRLSGNQTAKSPFCVLAKERRIAPRYDELAHYFLAALCLVAMLAYWL